MDYREAILRMMTGNLPPNQSPSAAVVDQKTGGPMAGYGRYGAGYSPDPSRPVPPDPPPRVTPEAAQMLFRLHEDIAKENPELGKILWTRIQAYTGDF